MKKILFVLPTLRWGGAEHITVTFAKSLPTDKFNIVFVTIGENKGELYDRITSSFPLISLEKKGVKFAFARFYKFIKRERPDFIFSSLVHTSVLVLLLNYLLPYKSIIRLPNMPSNKLYDTFKTKLMILLERLTYKKAKLIICQTEDMRKEAITKYHLKGGDVFTLINPIDKDLIDFQISEVNSPFPNEQFPTLVAIGSVVYRKGFDMLIGAFENFLTIYPKAHLYILGRLEGDYANKIKMLAEKCGHIHLDGFQPNPYPYIKFCDVFVLSSRMEGLPNVLLEALYLKKKIVATKCIPFVEDVIIDGKNGYKVNVDNKEEMVTALINIISMTYKEHTVPSSTSDFKDLMNILSLNK